MHFSANLADTVGTEIQEIKVQYKEIFEQKIGKIPNIKCSLKLRPNAKPTFNKVRDVPFARQEQTEKELLSLENDGIITKMETSD